MSAPKKRALDPTVVTARLVQKVPDGTPGATQVLGASYLPQPLKGLNGERGFQSGHYERWLNIEGPFTLTVPNSQGPDGKLHIQRFLQRTAPDFMAGDEWIEIRRDGLATLLYVGALINLPSTDIGQIQVGGYDALWLLKKVRETDAGFWNHAPRDTLEYYTRAWAFDVATAFPEPGAVPVTPTSGTTTGNFTYIECDTTTGLPVCRLTAASGGSSMGFTGLPPAIGYESADPYESWRVEVSCYVSAALPAGAAVQIASADQQLSLQVLGDPSVLSGASARLQCPGTPGTYVNAAVPGSALVPGQVDLAMEGRERWIYCYVQGELVGLIPMPTTHDPAVTCAYFANGGAAVVDVQAFSYRRGRAWLMRGADKGDYVLPGEPVPGGLQGSYFDAIGFTDTTGGADILDLVLNPTQQPYSQRVDPVISHSPGQWFPAAPASAAMARWTGSVFLDLATYDYRIKLDSSSFDASRLWLGKTRMGEQLLDLWPVVGATSVFPGGSATSSYLRSIFGETSGWYPIVIELFAQGGQTSTMTVTLERSDAPGTFSAIPPTQLSPEGIYSNQVRQDSHYDTFQAIAGAYGHQYTCEPRSLESGLFPGQVIPRVRVGTDRNIRVGTDDSTDLSLTSSGEDQAAMLQADASGIADPNGTAQLSATAINFEQATGHMFAVTETESLSDITDPGLLAQRLGTLLALRSGVWDQVASRPPGHPVITETWPPPLVPLPGKFAYLPGDGVLRDYPEFGVVDTSPTPLMSVAWDFTPFGIIAPQASYFTYPRGTYWTLRKFRQQAVAGKRNYQGQLATYPGSIGGQTGTAGGSPPTIAADEYSRLLLPANPKNLRRVTLNVTEKMNPATPWTIEINGANTGIPVLAVGEYVVTAFAGSVSASTQQQMVARLVTTAGTTDTVEYVLLAGIVVPT